MQHGMVASDMDVVCPVSSPCQATRLGLGELASKTRGIIVGGVFVLIVRSPPDVLVICLWRSAITEKQ